MKNACVHIRLCLPFSATHMCGAMNNVLLTTYYCIRFVSHSQTTFLLLYWVGKKRQFPYFLGILLHGFWLSWKAQWLALSSWNHTTASWLLRWMWKAGYLLWFATMPIFSASQCRDDHSKKETLVPELAPFHYLHTRIFASIYAIPYTPLAAHGGKS